MQVTSLIDDSYWRSINISVNDGNVCSYRMQNLDESQANNVFEVKLEQMDNLLVGLYYGSLSTDATKQFDKLKDMKIFKPADCHKMKHCAESKSFSDPKDPRFAI